MASIISDEKKILFLHLPKTGGTSIEKMLLSIPTFYALRDNIWDDGRLWGSMKKFDKTLEQKIKTYRVFCSVRHPVDRFISAYNDFFYTRIDKTYKSVNKNRKIPIVRALRDLKYVREKYRMFYWHGLIPLVDHLPPLKYLDYVIKFENFERELKDVFITLKLPIPKRIPHANKSKHVLTKLSNYDRQLVRKLFERDYEEFGYD